eukprot:SAG22_NODE_465_length_10181_cov_6.604444_16_plen_118_part_00
MPHLSAPELGFGLPSWSNTQTGKLLDDMRRGKCRAKELQSWATYRSSASRFDESSAAAAAPPPLGRPADPSRIALKPSAWMAPTTVLEEDCAVSSRTAGKGTVLDRKTVEAPGKGSA